MVVKLSWILLFVLYIATMIINMNVAMMGSKGMFINIVSSMIYLFLWILFIYFNRNYKFINFYWFATCLISMFTVIVNIIELNLSILIPVSIIFLTPLYGIRYFGISMLAFSLISFILSIFFIIFNKVVN